eukprot:1097112-Pyramimonas_sp.AAC.1
MGWVGGEVVTSEPHIPGPLGEQEDGLTTCRPHSRQTTGQSTQASLHSLGTNNYDRGHVLPHLLPVLHPLLLGHLLAS